MNRRSFLKSANAAGLALALPASTFAAQEKDRHEKEKKTTPTTAAPSPNTILLKDYRPVSIHKVPVTHVDKAKFPIIDMHSHPYPKTDTEITTWLKNMDEVNVEKTMILTMTTGKAFDDFYAKYSKYPDRFEVWCGLDFTGYKTAAFPDSAVKELERGKKKARKASAKFTIKDRACAPENPPRRVCIPTIRASTRSGKRPPNCICPSASTSPTRSGCTSPWTSTTTA